MSDTNFYQIPQQLAAGLKSHRRHDFPRRATPASA